MRGEFISLGKTEEEDMRRGGVFLGKKEAFQVGFSIREEVPREREKVRGEFISLGKTEEGNGGDIFERMT